MFHVVPGARQNCDGNILYLVELKSKMRAELISADRVSQLWPKKLISFLEERLVWRRTVNFEEDAPVVETTAPIGQARKISCKYIFI